MESFLEYLGAVAKMESDFTQKVKEKNNWQTARWDKDKLDNLARPIHNYNAIH